MMWITLKSFKSSCLKSSQVSSLWLPSPSQVSSLLFFVKSQILKTVTRVNSSPSHSDSSPHLWMIPYAPFLCLVVYHCHIFRTASWSNNSLDFWRMQKITENLNCTKNMFQNQCGWHNVKLYLFFNCATILDEKYKLTLVSELIYLSPIKQQSVVMG